MLAVAAAACQSFTQPKGSDLSGVVDRFHHDLRWEYNEDAAARVDPRRRSEFRDQLEDLSEDLSISDWKVHKVELDPQQERARLRVELRYTQLPSTVLRKEKVREIWQLIDGAWLLMSWQGGPLTLEAREPADRGQPDQDAAERQEPTKRGPDDPEPAPPKVRDLPADPDD